MLAAKTTSDANNTTPFPPDPNSASSTITTVAREIHEAGGQAAAVTVDVRDPQQIQHAIDETLRVFGKLDVLVYNSGAIWWSSVENTPLKRFKLMQAVNPEGLYASVQSALPVFGKGGWRGRIIVVCPPIYSRFFRGKTGYAIGMYLCFSLELEFVKRLVL
jgi:NAD(P)-dependent dehydrogenase (short-subunit alcohol dehydrogenase family)